MPSTRVPVSPGNCQSDGEGLSGQDQSRVEQGLLRAHNGGGCMRLGIFVHPFDRVVDADCDSFVDRIWIRTRREVFLEIRYVEP